MKLVVKALPKNNKGELLISVDYAQNEHGECQKIYCKGHAQGVPFDIPEESLAASILAKYPAFVKIAGTAAADDGVKAPAKNKMADGPGKTA